MSHIKELIHAYANIPTHTHTMGGEKGLREDRYLGECREDQK